MPPNTPAPTLANKIDRSSFILGMITAFAECVANESKKLAFSPPFYTEDYTMVKSDAKTITRDLSVQIWLETNADLALEKPLYWFVIYKFPEVLDEYQQLRTSGLNPALHFETFYSLLSYGSVWGDGAHAVSPKFREDRPQEDVFANILLKSGDWPVSPHIK
jgi:hypothetical protein